MTSAGPKVLAGFIEAPVYWIYHENELEPNNLSIDFYKSTYSSQMSCSNGQPNGKRTWSLMITAAVIANTMNNKDKNKCDQSLNYNGLANIKTWINGSITQIAIQNIIGGSKLKLSEKNWAINWMRKKVHRISKIYVYLIWSTYVAFTYFYFCI